MAKQYTTFSVVEILGQPAPADGTSDPHCDGGEKKSSPLVPVATYKPGKIKQMLPPLPTILCSTNINDQPFLYPAIQTSPSPPPPSSSSSSREEDVLAIVQPYNENATASCRKRIRRTSSSCSDTPLEIVDEEGEDDVFRGLICRRRSSGSARADRRPSAVPRDLTSSGETPSPPAGTSSTTTKSSSKKSKPNTSSSSSDQPEDEIEEEEKPRKKRVRTAYTKEQLQTMECHFRKTAYPDNHLIRLISREAGIPLPKIQVWFQNRRAKARKWGQVLPESTNNSILHRGVLPSADSSRYLPPLSSSSSTSGSTAPPLSIPPPPPPTTSNPLASTSLVSSILSPYQRFYTSPPPPYPLPSTYPLLPPPPPYPLSYSLYTRLPPSTTNQIPSHYLSHSSSGLHPSPITVDKQQ